jgi:hypothetical protein
MSTMFSMHLQQPARQFKNVNRTRKVKSQVSLLHVIILCLSVSLLLRLDEWLEFGLLREALGTLGIDSSSSLYVSSKSPTQQTSFRSNRGTENEDTISISDPKNAIAEPQVANNAAVKADVYDYDKKNVIFPKPLKSGNNEVKVLLTLCTTVKDNVHFIVEWIEYMRIQGVDRLVIADDDSTDNLDLLKRFYQRVAPDFDLRIFPRLQPGIEYGGQPRNLQHCVDTFRNLSDWILVSDTNEFLYSPSHGTLRRMLQALPALEQAHGILVDSIYAPCYRFGSGGRRRRFQYRLEAAPDGAVAYRGCWAAGRRPELMLRQTRRGPLHSSYQAGAAAETALNERLRGSPACREAELRNGGMTCEPGPGKTLFRPSLVEKARAARPSSPARLLHQDYSRPRPSATVPGSQLFPSLPTS